MCYIVNLSNPLRLFFSVIKLRAKGFHVPPPEAVKSTDIDMGTNQAYESVDARYQTGGRCIHEDAEVIYELPAV